MKTIVILSLILLAAKVSSGQGVAINETGHLPHVSAILDISSGDKGLLVPRMSEDRRNDIENPATGLLIYQTDGVTGFYYNAGTTSVPDWQPVKSYEGVWTQDGNNIYYNTGNVGIGTATPSALLHTSGTGTGGGMCCSPEALNRPIPVRRRSPGRAPA